MNICPPPFKKRGLCKKVRINNTFINLFQLLHACEIYSKENESSIERLIFVLLQKGLCASSSAFRSSFCITILISFLSFKGIFVKHFSLSVGFKMFDNIIRHRGNFQRYILHFILMISFDFFFLFP